MPDDNKTPLDAVVDLFVYAPLGLALAARDSLPDLIARGRQQWESQSAMAKMMGEYAVGEAEKRAKKRLDEVAEILNGLGVLGAQTPKATAARPAPASGQAPAQGAPASARSNGKTEAPPRVSADLAIPGYDTLSASQVVQRLAGLAAPELEALREYESATRGRRTILSKIAQLQSADSAP